MASNPDTPIPNAAEALSQLPDSPNQNQIPTTITEWSQLPLEIRRLIWGFVLPQKPRFVQFKRYRKPVKLRGTIYVSFAKGEDWCKPVSYGMTEDNSSILLLLRTCQESRKAALKYEVIWGTEPGSQPFYFDVEKDILCDTDDCLFNFDIKASDNFFQNLRSLYLVCTAMTKSHWIYPGLQRFTGLKELGLVFHQKNRSYREIIENGIVGLRDNTLSDTTPLSTYILPGGVHSTTHDVGYIKDEIKKCLVSCEVENPDFKQPQKVLSADFIYERVPYDSTHDDPIQDGPNQDDSSEDGFGESDSDEGSPEESDSGEDVSGAYYSGEDDSEKE